MKVDLGVSGPWFRAALGAHSVTATCEIVLTFVWLSAELIGTNRSVVQYSTAFASVPFGYEHPTRQRRLFYIPQWLAVFHLLIFHRPVSSLLPSRTAMDSILVSASVTFLVLAIVWVKQLLVSRSSSPLPPNPKGLPILGNLLDLASDVVHVKARDWSQQFGLCPSFIPLPKSHPEICSNCRRRHYLPQCPRKHYDNP